jgi:hypothetical protein
VVAPLRLALDENFPWELLERLKEWLPPEVEIVHINDLDPRLRGPKMGDRRLIIALHQLGFDGLITNNWRMLNIPMETAAIVATKCVLIAMQDMGDDPIRASGALLLELPGLSERLKAGVSNVFLLNYEKRRPKDGWTWLQTAADREGISVSVLHDEVKVTPHELATPVLT